MINCPNPECQATNPEGNETCVSCQTFLPHRYLWAVSQGELGQLDQRYSYQHQRVVLDTQPGIPPLSPEPVPPHIQPYLILAPHSLHVPQPYALLNDSAGNNDEVLLLDTPAIAVSPGEAKPKLLPSLVEAWPSASPLRQLNWLWQVAGLLPDFIEQRVASSLLPGEVLRVQGSLVRLLALSTDPQPFTLKALGAAWQTLVEQAQPSIQDFLGDLCNQLIQETITTPDVLVACLDHAIAIAASAYQVDYRLSVLTDQGPSRKRNEDACYPNSGKAQTYRTGAQGNSDKTLPLLLLVCDGIGGHEGGDVASRLAIATVQQQLSPLLKHLSTQTAYDSVAITLAIEQAVHAANDTIAQHNDQGLRQARDRMGTTLVMALIIGVHIYIAHVGDSRAYRISTNSCLQITFDDDVAAREVRLGYGFYADVTHRPGTGALIQALGMGSSSILHVVVQRLILDDDIALLLCSDGLSDYDRIEQFWKAHLLPVVTGQLKPDTAVTNLVQLANTHNGHDNVTVGVISGHVSLSNPTVVPVPSLPPPPPPLPTLTKTPPVTPITSAPLPVTQRAIPAPSPPKQPMRLWAILLGIVSLLGALTALTMLFFRDNLVIFSKPPAPPLPETVQEQINHASEPVGITATEQSQPSLMPGSYLQLSQPVTLLADPQATENDDNELGQLPEGATVQILTRQDIAGGQSIWVKLKVCAPNPGAQDDQSQDSAPGNADASESPSGESASTVAPTISDSEVTPSGLRPLTSGTQGWVLAAQLAKTARTEALNCPPQ